MVKVWQFVKVLAELKEKEQTTPQNYRPITKISAHYNPHKNETPYDLVKNIQYNIEQDIKRGRDGKRYLYLKSINPEELSIVTIVPIFPEGEVRQAFMNLIQNQIRKAKENGVIVIDDFAPLQRDWGEIIKAGIVAGFLLAGLVCGGYLLIDYFKSPAKKDETVPGYTFKPDAFSLVKKICEHETDKKGRFLNDAELESIYRQADIDNNKEITYKEAFDLEARKKREANYNIEKAAEQVIERITQKQEKEIRRSLTSDEIKEMLISADQNEDRSVSYWEAISLEKLINGK